MTDESINQFSTPTICVIDAGMPSAKVMRAFAKMKTDGANLNPFAQGNSDKIAELAGSMLPNAEPMSAEEKASFEQERLEGEARYRKARFGPLPEGCYRLLEQGGFEGLHYELEIDGKEIILRKPDSKDSEYAAFNDKKLADKLARAEIARLQGQEAADTATFTTVWGGCL